MLAAVIICNNEDDHVGYSGIGSCGMQHQKKSEVQIGKESRGVSSDYQRAPLLTLPNDSNDIGILGWQDEVLSTPHKRVGQVMQSNKGKAMAMAKLTRNPSSLSRSPTIKDRIDTFPCLHETSDHKPSRWIWQEIAARRRSDRDEMMTGRRFKFQVLLPPFVIVSIPCFWWYLKVVQKDQALVDLPSDAMDVPSDTIVLGLWFDFFAVLVFVTAVVISIKIAFPQLSVGYILPSMRLVRGKLGQSWGCLAVAWMKPIAGLLADGKERKRIPGSPSVTWTIGSKPKLERSKIVREGVQVYSNGDVYEGEFHQGKCSGSGVYYYYMSGRYEGDWVDGKYDGYGVETWARGSRYRGQYRQGLRHGYGVYRFYTGDVYAGEWCNGQSHGYGVHTCEDGSRYVGEFKWGVKHGLGYYHFRNGDTYSGEYFADKMHGFGVYHFANGHRYEGAWHEGRKQGLGMYIFRNGERQSGNWHQGVLETPSTQSSQPGPPIAVNHSKVLNAVQEARRAAEKAFEIPRVDERVNKAISAANRAANAARVAAVKAVQKRMHGNVPVPDV